MFGLGVQELVVVGFIFLMVFGPHKLPQMARSAGSFVARARGAMDEFKAGMDPEVDRPMPDEYDVPWPDEAEKTGESYGDSAEALPSPRRPSRPEIDSGR